MKRGPARIGTAAMALCLASAAAGSAPPVLLQRSVKICQVLGECDRERGGAGTCTNGLRGQPTLNVTESRYGLFGTDLGASFEHNGQLFFLFGDTIPSGFHAPPTARPHDSDSIASSTDADPEDCLSLQFVTAADGYYLPLQVAIPSGDAAAPVDLGSFETPVGGFSANGTMYVFFTTDAVVTSSAITLGRSVLAKSTDGGRSFTHVYDASTNKFINVAPVVVDNADVPGLPRSTGQGLLLWASNTAYRRSDPYLAYVPLDSVEDHTTWRYFAGTKSGQPVWSAAESSAVPLFATTPCIGELSVSWNPFLRNWLMLYNCLDPRGINLRAASLPWGPWSSSAVIFDPVVDSGYCHFIHWSDAASPTPLGGSAPCDSLSDSGANNTFGGEYGPYFISRYTRADTSSTTIYYLMSTFNPYTAVLMKAALRTNCAPAPLAGCRKPTAAAASTVQLKRNAKITKNAVTWTWNKGAATALADFGDPTTHTAYGLCVYDSTPALVLSLSAPAGGTCGRKACWASTKAGFKYSNKDATPDGLFLLQLAAGAAGKAKIVAKGKGPNLAMPAFPLPQNPSIVVQVQNSDGGCWEADYSAPATTNSGTKFKDTSD